MNKFSRLILPNLEIKNRKNLIRNQNRNLKHLTNIFKKRKKIKTEEYFIKKIKYRKIKLENQKIFKPNPKK